MPGVAGDTEVKAQQGHLGKQANDGSRVAIAGSHLIPSWGSVQTSRKLNYSRLIAARANFSSQYPDATVERTVRAG